MIKLTLIIENWYFMLDLKDRKILLLEQKVEVLSRMWQEDEWEYQIIHKWLIVGNNGNTLLLLENF